MLSFRLVLVPVAMAITVLLASGKPATALPPCDLKIVSKLKQAGITEGGAAVSTTGSTQGSGVIKCVFKSPTSVVKKAATGNSGVSGASISADNGAFKNLVEALTDVKTTKKGTKVKTESAGEGATTGKATTLQNAAANGAATLTTAEIDLLTSGKGLFKVKEVKRGSATSSNSHKASGSGKSLFKVLNLGETELKLEGTLSDELDD
nr:CP19k-like protein 5 [Tetraclita japonica formosana]